MSQPINPTRRVTLNQPTNLLDESVRSRVVEAVNSAFEFELRDATDAGESWCPPPVAQADQLKAWLADHWLALEESLVLLLPGKDIEPGVLNVNVNGSDVFVGIAALESFKQAAEKLGEVPSNIEAIFQSSTAYSLPVWICSE